MATNFATPGVDANMVRHARSAYEHRFFLTVAVLFPLITVIGYAPTYYFKPLFNTPPLPSVLVHVHALLMSSWIALFCVQAYLISAKNIRLHMKLGMLSVILAVAMIVVGTMTGYAAAIRGAAFPGYTAHEFFIVPIGDMITFAILFASIILLRKDAASHKRLVLVSVVNFIGPSIARLPFPFIPALGAWYFFGVPSLIGIALVIADTYRNGKLNKAFAAGMSLMILSGPIRIMLSKTAAWEQFANWVLS